ncbi:MAG: glycosyltransferase family 39 protein [Acetobacteraceae bacterium]|nr:glycosyltransferase family 39 protein [Acetobacteraceae bacterium]
MSDAAIVPAPPGTNIHLDSERPITLCLILAAFIATWFAFGVLTSGGKALHNDMTEAYVWGREFQLGYNQHPPFWAWIAGLWFMVFPRTDWPFVLLAVVNSAVGLIGAWRLIGLFARGWLRRAAMLLLLCTPFYTFKSYNFNANSIFLALWPWTYYFFIQSLENRRAAPSALFGMMVGLCLLSKYYTIVLILTCLLASFAHPDWRLYYRSARPRVAVGIAALLFLPHVVWAALSHAPPVEYALGITGLGLPLVIENSFAFLLEITAFHGVVIGIVLLSRRWKRAGAASVPAEDPVRGRFLTLLVFLPVMFTVLFGLVFELKIGGKMTIGIFPLVPLWLLLMLGAVDMRRCFKVAAFVCIATSAGALLAAPGFTMYTFEHPGRDPAYLLPQKELADVATRLWHTETNAPLRLVGGSKFIGNAVAFYSEDHPSAFVLLSFREAPWVTPALLHREGLLAVCLHDDPDCIEIAEHLAEADTKRSVLSLQHEYLGAREAAVPIDVFITPPHGS